MQATGPVMSSVALWSQEQLGHQQGQAGGRGRTVLSVCVTRCVFPVCYPAGPFPGSGIYPPGHVI